MRTKIVEVTQHKDTGFNWGKILVGQFEEEWTVPSVIGQHQSVLAPRGWGPNHRLVLDLETGEGAMFSFPIGSARADLDKHKVWVCPMYSPFIEHLQAIRWAGDLDELPDVVELPDAPATMAGYRRGGKG
jgi:hypothetical protein